MLRPRVIPCLLVRRGGLVKTLKFRDEKYVGDPINAVRIFNEKEADELIVLDIDASAGGKEPDYQMIGHLAEECRMPLCYGGGVKSAEQARRIMALGVEKVAVSSGALERPVLVTEIAEQVGRQSVVVVLDVKKTLLGGYRVYINNGRKDTGRVFLDCARDFESRGAGEIVLNSIDLDGAKTGYDLKLARELRAAVNVPVTLLGGAGSFADLASAVEAVGIVGLAAGSLFVFKGTYRAVLISYLSQAQRVQLQTTAQSVAPR
jgi:cyclase